MKKIQFPSNLLTENNRYGNQFMVIYINEPVKGLEYKLNNNQTVLDRNGISVPSGLRRTTIFSEGGPAFDRSSTGAGATVVKYAIFLPIPMSLKTNYGVSYKNFEIGTEAMKLAGGVVDTAKDIVSKLASGFRGAAAGAKTAAGLNAITDLGKTAATAYGVYSGLSINPHTELLFEGVKFREFEFNYKLIARERSESDSIKEIINLLRFHMHPELDGYSLLFKYPSDFDIAFYYIDKGGIARENTYITFIMTSLLQDISVNYSGNNNFASFKDSFAPVEIDMSLKLREKQILTKEIIEKIQQSIETNENIQTTR
jgi:hypothetical protein